MKILLTGSYGMVGRNILYKKKNNYKYLITTRQNLDLKNFTKTRKFFIENKPDIILHAAGDVGGILYNKENNMKLLMNNYEIGKNVILAAYESKIKKIINLSSSCVYPANLKSPFKENQILNGRLEQTNEGYALAKIVVQKLCSYINDNYRGYKYKTIIPCNLFGKFDSFDQYSAHMIPSAIAKIYAAKISSKKSVKIWGSGKNKREFMYAADFANFINFAIKNFDKIPSIMNVGTGKEYSINYYYKIISKILDYKVNFINDLKYPNGIKTKLLNISEQKKLKWSPQYTLESGIKETCEYYIKNLK